MDNITQEHSKISKPSVIYAVCACVFAVLLGGAYIWSALGCYDAPVHLYLADNFYVVAVGWGTAVVIVLLLSSIFVLKKSELPIKQSPAGTVCSFFSGASGFLLAAFALMRIFEYIRGTYVISRYEMWGIIAVPFAVLGSVYFIGQAVSKKAPGRPYSLFACGAVVWSALMLVDSYFDMHTPHNSPPRILIQLAFITVMLYLLFETRYLLGTPKPSVYVGVACCALVMIAVSSAFHIALIATGYYQMNADTLVIFALVTIGGYIASRLFSYVLHRGSDAAPETVSASDISEETKSDPV